MEPEQQHQEREIHLKDYLKVLRKHVWTVAVAFTAVVTLVTISTFRQTPVYQASAQLQIEKENPNILSIQEVMELDAGQSDYYQTQYKILESRSLARGVIERLGLEALPEFDPELQNKGLIGGAIAGLRSLVGGGDEGSVSPESGEDQRKSRTVNLFLEKITVEPLRNTRLVNVKAESFDPALAAKMANALSELYIERDLQLKLTTTSQAGDWLTDRLGEARAKLDESEQALQAYKERNSIVSLGERQNFMVQKLEELNTEFTRARTARIEAETRYNQLKRIGEGADGTGYDSITGVMSDPLVRQLKADLAKLQAELAELSKTYTPKHPKIISLYTRIQTMRDRIEEEVQRVVQGIRNEYELARKREESISRAIEEQKLQAQLLNQKSIEYGVLEREVENNSRIYEMLTSRSKETDLAGGMRTSNIRLVDRAEVPLRPIRPRKARNLALALILGMALGVGGAFFLEYFDDTVRDPDDIERVGLPYLGAVAQLKPKAGGEKGKDFISLKEPKTSYAEAYRDVRTSLLFANPDQPLKSILLTSPGPGEGKSLTAVNLALTIAMAGKRVLLVDADMRKPRIHKVFDMENAFGLSNLLAGDDDVGKAIHETKVPNLHVITSGRIPPNPSELLGTKRMTKLLALLGERFDRVMFDSTPLIAVTDATVLASRVDGVILVVKSGATGRHILERAKKKLAEVQARLIGAVLNMVDMSKSTYYYSSYYYQRYYGEDSNGKGKSKKRSPGKAKAKAPK